MERRATGRPKPWTNDPVFLTTYFCNVRREDDRVTKWIREHYEGRVVDAAFNMLIARLVNKPESLEAMGWPFQGWNEGVAAQFGRVMSQHGAWGNAYIVSTNGRSMPKWEYVVGLLWDAFEPIQQVASATTLAEAHKLLMGIHGLASFMAGQIVADLKNTEGHPLSKAPDWWTWCAHGPGSLRGMAWVLGKEKVTPKEFYDNMPILAELVERRMAYGAICNQDLQNCLCEFDKFMRVKYGTGRSKRKYNGR